MFFFSVVFSDIKIHAREDKKAEKSQSVRRVTCNIVSNEKMSDHKKLTMIRKKCNECKNSHNYEGRKKILLALKILTDFRLLVLIPSNFSIVHELAENYRGEKRKMENTISVFDCLIFKTKIVKIEPEHKKIFKVELRLIRGWLGIKFNIKQHYRCNSKL